MDLKLNGYSSQNGLKAQRKLTSIIKEETSGNDESRIKRVDKKYTKRILSKIGHKTYVLKVEDIVYFQILNGSITAYNNSQREFPLSVTTLTELEEGLNPKLFFRINRGEIINLNFVENFEQFYKDRVSVSLRGVKTNLITSNSRASDFRKWIVG